MVGKYVEWYFHVFVSGHGCAKLEVFDVKACVACSLGADCAVPQDFGCCEFCGTRGEFSGVIDEVTARGEADAVGVGFLWSVIDNNSCVCYGSIGQNFAYFVMT